MLLWTLGCMHLFKLVFFVSFGHIPRSRIAKLYGSLIFSFLRPFHIAFHGVQRLYSHQQCTKVPLSSYTCQSLLFVVLLMIAILSCMSWYLTVLLICMSLVISHAEYLFMCQLATCMPSLEKYLFRSSAHFLIRLLFDKL